jgi:glycosyltransferase involved in cell wall biosynthesis
MRQDSADVPPIIPPSPQVTLVVPNYNHARYLQESLGSIAAQTRAPDRVLIVDDASTDDSVSIISRFIAERRGWELIQHKENRGVVRRQNETLAAVTTEWIGFLGADDVLQPTYLEKALAEAARHPEVGLICACSEIIGLSERRMLRPMMLPARSSTVLAPADVRKILLAGDNYFPGMVSLFRRKATLSLGGFDENLGSFADSLLARQLALSFGFFFLAEILGYWRIHGQNFSITSTSDPAVLSTKVAQIRNLIKHSDLFPSGFDELFERRTRFGAVRTVLSAKTPVGVRAAQAAALLKGGDYERRFLKLMLGLGYPGRIAALAWVTLRTRPMSLLRLVGQLDARRAILAGSTAYRAP